MITNLRNPIMASPHGYGAPPSTCRFLQPSPFMPPNHTLHPPSPLPPLPVMQFGDLNNNNCTQMMDQLNCSNINVVNLTEQIIAMRSVIDNLRIDNSRLTSAVEERLTNITPPHSCTPNGGNLQIRSELFGNNEQQRYVNNVANNSTRNDRNEEGVARAMRSDRNGCYDRDCVSHGMLNDVPTMARTDIAPVSVSMNGAKFLVKEQYVAMSITTETSDDNETKEIHDVVIPLLSEMIVKNTDTWSENVYGLQIFLNNLLEHGSLLTKIKTECYSRHKIEEAIKYEWRIAFDSMRHKTRKVDQNNIRKVINFIDETNGKFRSAQYDCDLKGKNYSSSHVKKEIKQEHKKKTSEQLKRNKDVVLIRSTKFEPYSNITWKNVRPYYTTKKMNEDYKFEEADCYGVSSYTCERAQYKPRSSPLNDLDNCNVMGMKNVKNKRHLGQMTVRMADC